MLEPNEKAVFDGIVTQLRAGDPRLAHRLDRLCRPHGRRRRALAVLLWTVAPLCIIFGGWTGLLMACVAVSYGASLYHRSGASADDPTWTRPHRPGIAN